MAQKHLITALNGRIKAVMERTNCTERLTCNANKQKTCIKCRRGNIVHTCKMLACATALHGAAALRSYAMPQQKQRSIRACNHTQCLSRGNLASKYAAICLYPNQLCKDTSVLDTNSTSSLNNVSLFLNFVRVRILMPVWFDCTLHTIASGLAPLATLPC